MAGDSKPSKEKGGRILVNDEHFKRIRSIYQLEDDFLDSWLDFSKLKDGGGKGGDLMYCSPDHRFLLKELKDHDHESLTQFGAPLIDHYIDGPTIMCAILIHFQEPSRNNKAYFVMANMLPSHGPWHGRYDLKGCQDDKALEVDGEHVVEVHKRIWHCHMWLGRCCWSPQRKRYYDHKKSARNLKINVTPVDRKKIMDALTRDVEFLQKCGLMDYSLLLGQRRVSIDEIRASKISSNVSGDLHIDNVCRVFVTEVEGDPDSMDFLYIGIIDFLQGWTMSKKIAKAIKVLERDKPTIPPIPYGDRFLKHFTNALVEVPTGEGPSRIESFISSTPMSPASASRETEDMMMLAPEPVVMEAPEPIPEAPAEQPATEEPEAPAEQAATEEPKAPATETEPMKVVRQGSVGSERIGVISAPDDDPSMDDEMRDM